MQARDPGPAASERRQEAARHRWLFYAALCEHHRALLEAAGERGREYAQSRIRYWLEAEDAP